MVDEWTPFGGSFLLLIHFALIYTFVYKYSAHRSEKVTRKAPNLYLQVCAENAMLQSSKVVCVGSTEDWIMCWATDSCTLDIVSFPCIIFPVFQDF